MKKLSFIAAILLLTITIAFAHNQNEIGPNGGRIIEFSTNQTVHGEVTLTNGVFRVAILDKDMKPVRLTDQSLIVTGGTRQKQEKPVVEKKGSYFQFPELKGNRYMLVFQYKNNPSDKPITARFEYDKKPCPTCKNPEWLCSCANEKK